MIIRPTVDDLLEGVRRTLELGLLPRLDELPQARDTLKAVLGILARVEHEWDSVGLAVAKDNEDLIATLGAVTSRLTSAGIAPRELLDAVSGLHDIPRLTAREASEFNVAAKAALVVAIRAVGLPAADVAPEPAREADREVRALLRRMTEREIAAIPPIDIDRLRASRAAHAADDIPALAARVRAFIAAELATSGGRDPIVTELTRITTGGSRDTWFFALRYTDSEALTVEVPCVLQREAVGSVLESDRPGVVGSRRRPETEFAIIRTMERHGVSVPGMLWVETTGTVLGRPFCITRRAAGDGSDAELFDGPDSPRRRRLYCHIVENLARIHDVDVRESGLDRLGIPMPRHAAAEQVAVFAETYRRQRLEDYPVLEYLLRWASVNAPVTEGVSLVHGDYRRGNLLYDGDQVSAVLDWEQAHLGDAEEDIAFAYWPLWTLEPAIPLDEFIRLYEKCRGIEVDRGVLAFYRMFIELKMTVVLLTGINSYFATEERQLNWAMAPSSMLNQAMLRCLDELDGGGPTYDWRFSGGGPRAI